MTESDIKNLQWQLLALAKENSKLSERVATLEARDDARAKSHVLANVLHEYYNVHVIMCHKDDTVHDGGQGPRPNQ